MILMLYNYNTEYSTIHYTACYNIAINSTGKNWSSFNLSDGITVTIVASQTKSHELESRIALLAARVANARKQ